MPGPQQDSSPSSWGSVRRVFINLTVPGIGVSVGLGRFFALDDVLRQKAAAHSKSGSRPSSGPECAKAMWLTSERRGSSRSAGIVKLRLRVAEYADDEPSAQLSRIPISP